MHDKKKNLSSIRPKIVTHRTVIIGLFSCSVKFVGKINEIQFKGNILQITNLDFIK